jgi:hypothetical protein
MSDEENLSEAILALAGDGTSPPKSRAKERSSIGKKKKAKTPRKKKHS